MENNIDRALASAAGIQLMTHVVGVAIPDFGT